MNTRHVEKLARMAKQFAKMYDDYDIGLLAIGENEIPYVQIDESAMAFLIKTYPNWEINKTKDQEYPYKATIVINGVKFLSIGTRREFRDAGIPLPESHK